MTVETTDRRINYAANGVKTNFIFNFKVSYADTVKVKEDGILTAATVVINLNADQDDNPGGSVDVTPAILSPIIVSVVREVTGDQQADYIPGDDFASSSHEQALDDITMYAQEVNDKMSRAIVANEAEDLSGISLLLPKPVDRALLNLGFDALGNLATVLPADAVSGVSAYIESLLPSVDSVAARTILESVGIIANNLVKGNNTFEEGINYAIAAGTDAYTASFTPALEVYNNGAYYLITFSNTNTIAAPTLNINGLGARTLLNFEGLALLPGQLKGDHIVRAGANLRVMNPHMASAGVWTPKLHDGSNSDAEGQTYSRQIGRWAKINKEFQFRGDLVMTSKGTLSGGLRIAGLPEVADDISSSSGACCISDAIGLNLPVAGQNLGGIIEANVQYVRLRKWSSTGGSTDLDASEVTNSAQFRFFGSFTVV